MLFSNYVTFLNIKNNQYINNITQNKQAKVVDINNNTFEEDKKFYEETTNNYVWSNIFIKKLWKLNTDINPDKPYVFDVDYNKMDKMFINIERADDAVSNIYYALAYMLVRDEPNSIQKNIKFTSYISNPSKIKYLKYQIGLWDQPYLNAFKYYQYEDDMKYITTDFKTNNHKSLYEVTFDLNNDYCLEHIYKHRNNEFVINWDYLFSFNQNQIYDNGDNIFINLGINYEYLKLFGLISYATYIGTKLQMMNLKQHLTLRHEDIVYLQTALNCAKIFARNEYFFKLFNIDTSNLRKEDYIDFWIHMLRLHPDKRKEINDALMHHKNYYYNKSIDYHILFVKRIPFIFFKSFFNNNCHLYLDFYINTNNERQKQRVELSFNPETKMFEFYNQTFNIKDNQLFLVLNKNNHTKNDIRIENITISSLPDSSIYFLNEHHFNLTKFKNVNLADHINPYPIIKNQNAKQINLNLDPNQNLSTSLKTNPNYYRMLTTFDQDDSQLVILDPYLKQMFKKKSNNLYDCIDLFNLQENISFSIIDCLNIIFIELKNKTNSKYKYHIELNLNNLQANKQQFKIITNQSLKNDYTELIDFINNHNIHHLQEFNLLCKFNDSKLAKPFLFYINCSENDWNNLIFNQVSLTDKKSSKVLTINYNRQISYIDHEIKKEADDFSLIIPTKQPEENQKPTKKPINEHKNNNYKLYFYIGLAVVGFIMILIIVYAILAKKRKQRAQTKKKAIEQEIVMN